jgi:hypothetical protein
MALSGLQFVAAVRPPPWWCPSPCLGGGEMMPRGNSCPGSSWTMAATFTDAVPFLKASLRLLPAPIHSPGENPRSLDRAVMALSRRVLLEDTALEFIACRSLTVGRQRCGIFGWRSLCLTIFGKACFVPCPHDTTLVLLVGL